MRKLRKNDEVVVITGRDKGRRGKIVRVLDDHRAIVAGVNVVKKHVKPNPNIGEQGGIKEKEAPIQISNIAIWNTGADKADRVGFKTLEDGKKVRIFKSNQEVIDA
jgi:large subunit ribosomal protein L24